MSGFKKEDELLRRVQAENETIKKQVEDVTNLCSSLQETVRSLLPLISDGRSAEGYGIKRMREAVADETGDSAAQDHGASPKKLKQWNDSPDSSLGAKGNRDQRWLQSTDTLTIPQSGVTGVSWYGGQGNNTYWVAQWHDEKRQKKELFPTGKQTDEFPLGVNYSEALRRAIRRRREMVKKLNLRSRGRQDSYPPITTIEAFEVPKHADFSSNDPHEELLANVIEFLSDETDDLYYRMASTSEVLRYMMHYSSLNKPDIEVMLISMLSMNRLITNDDQNLYDKYDHYTGQQTKGLPRRIYFPLVPHSQNIVAFRHSEMANDQQASQQLLHHPQTQYPTNAVPQYLQTTLHHQSAFQAGHHQITIPSSNIAQTQVSSPKVDAPQSYGTVQSVVTNVAPAFKRH